jgi:ankyrin repeat protein
VVGLLLDKGANANAQGGHYGNALQAASYRGDAEVIGLLLDKGAEVNAQGGTYDNALYAASTRGHAEIVMLLVDKGADVNAQGGKYDNALYIASTRGYAEVIGLLLDKGAEVNAQGGEYGNALYAASYRGHAEVVGLLLDKGADVNAQGGLYGNAFFAALGKERKDIAALLSEKDFRYDDVQHDLLGRSRMLLAACYGYLSGLEQDLESRSASIDAVDNHQWTALHWAAYFGQVDVVDLLLRCGAKSAKVDWQDWTARDVALFAGHEHITRRLEQFVERSNSIVPGRRHPRGGYCDSCGYVSWRKQWNWVIDRD